MPVITITGIVYKLVYLLSQARANVQNLFPALAAGVADGSIPRRRIHLITRDEFKDMWCTLAKYIIRRREVEEQAYVDMEEFKRLSVKLANTESLAEQEEILLAMEQLQKYEPSLAFASREDPIQKRTPKSKPFHLGSWYKGDLI